MQVSNDSSKLEHKDENFYRNQVVGKIQKKTLNKINYLIKKLKWISKIKK